MATVEDHRLARELATGAGDLLIRLRDRLVASGADVDTIRTCGDLAAHHYLVDRLRAERPDDAVLSEEHAAEEHSDRSRLTASRVWIVDPLDGTREYGEGRDDFAVHVALVENHRPTAGAVALPAEGIVFDTLDPPRLPERTDRAADAPLRIAVSRSRPPALADTLVADLGAGTVPMGSAGVKVVAVVRGLADAYVHAGGQFQWDNCAPAAVALAAGVTCTRLDGSELSYNGPDLSVPDLLVCRPELLDLLRSELDEIEAREPGAVRPPAERG
ncbi:MAG: 3'(2'),5'-bisphosphate nucleotidase CysQ [Acidobacteria bacterium]|nr:3'(2'),5'-bisphosphate nucleotidase CysQ [Acidobacteriota bacterium]